MNSCNTTLYPFERYTEIFFKMDKLIATDEKMDSSEKSRASLSCSNKYMSVLEEQKMADEVDLEQRRMKLKIVYIQSD